jgi:ATP-binding cassette subfamily B protein
VLLAHGAFRKLSTSITALARAAIAGREIQPLLRVAGQPEAAPSPEYAVETETGAGRSGPLLVAAGLSYRYPERPEPVLSRCSLTVEPGDHLLLTGPSGGGKSTLGALLTGLRAPTAGLLLLEGLDHFTLGLDGWRRRVAAAPQFHENHVITETLAFNLLMGRGWPPSPEDMEEADEVCRALGLGELIDRMPAGLLQVVGETGWHLSHGERSRLYIARTLLQRAKLLVLDESFAALDPGTLARSLDAVLERAPALLVIAHP